MSVDPFLAPEDEEQPDRLWVPPERRLKAPPPVEIEVRRKCHFKKKPEKKRGCLRCGKPKGDRDHMGVPPSFNAGGSGMNRFAYQGMKKSWAWVLTELLEEARLPRPLGYVFVEGIMGFPDRREDRDQGNFRILIEKVLGDVLEEGGWLASDSWDHYEFGNLQRTYDRGESWTRLMLQGDWPRGGEAGAAPNPPPPGQETLLS